MKLVFAYNTKGMKKFISPSDIRNIPGLVTVYTPENIITFINGEINFVHGAPVNFDAQTYTDAYAVFGFSDSEESKPRIVQNQEEVLDAVKELARTKFARFVIVDSENNHAVLGLDKTLSGSGKAYEVASFVLDSMFPNK